MVSEDGTIKLSDLGLAKHVDDDFSSTINGAAIGSPNYISPEQVRNAKMADCRSDIYSLGATLYHALTGQVPYLGASAMDVMLKHCNDKLVSPKEINSELPSQLCKIICKMMAKLPENRYQSCAEVSEALYKFINSKPKKKNHSKRQVNLEGTKIERLIRQKPITKRKRKPINFLPIIIILILLIPILIYLVLKQS
jgi:serine/threonine-protein kinase